MSKKAKQAPKTSRKTKGMKVDHRPRGTEQASKQHNIRWRFACLLPALIVLLSYILSRPKDIHEDEIYWIGSSYYYQLAVIDGDASNTDWQLLPARENPVLGKYVLGAALQFAGHPITTPDLLGSFYLIFADMPGAWGSDEAFEKRLAVAGRVEPSLRDEVRSGRGIPLDDSQLSVARHTSLLFGMLAAIGLAILGQQCHWRVGGVLAGILFGLHPIVSNAYSLAMIDIIAMAFSIWFMVGLVSILRLPKKTGLDCNEQSRTSKQNKPQSSDETARATSVQKANAFLNRSFMQQVAVTLFTAVMLAFACGCKMNSLIVAATAAGCGIWCLFQALRYRTGQSALSQGSVTQQHAPPGFVNLTPEILNTRVWMLITVGLLAVILFIGTNPALYGDPIDGVLALSYEHALTADLQEDMLGGRLTTISERVQALATLVCRGPLGFIGMCMTVGWIAYYCVREQSIGIILVLWWAIALLLLMMWIPFEWERYALPLLPPTMLILGATLEIIGNAAWSKLTRSRSTVVS